MKGKKLFLDMGFGSDSEESPKVKQQELSVPNLTIGVEE